MVNSTKQRRKFQVCNGYLLEFDQLARVLSFLADNAGQSKISRDTLVEGTGLANRQIESLVSVGAAMGLIRPGNQVLTDVGKMVAEFDVFIEARGTLEWCHYMGAGSKRNLIWYEIFNTIVPAKAPMSADGWMDCLREMLAGQYSDRTIGKHLHEEVRFVADAYMQRNFKRLGILHEAGDGRLYRARKTELTQKVLAAALYQFGEESGSGLIQIEDLMDKPGSPGLLFGLDQHALREMIEELHRNEWVYYESTHNLDQIRLNSELSPLDFLAAYYKNEPVARNNA